jgi:hypothetical protein
MNLQQLIQLHAITDQALIELGKKDSKEKTKFNGKMIKKKDKKEMSSRMDKLIQLREMTDRIIEFARYDDEDEQGNILGTAAKVGVGAAGVGAVGYGGYKADQAIMGKYGTRNTLQVGSTNQVVNPGAGGFTMNTPGTPNPLTAQVGRPQAYRAAASDLSNVIRNRTGAAWQAGRHATNVTAGRGAGTLESILAGVKKGAKVAFH